MNQEIIWTVACCTAVGLLIAVHSLLYTLVQQVLPGPLAVLEGLSVAWSEVAFRLVQEWVLAQVVVTLLVQQSLLPIERLLQ